MTADRAYIDNLLKLDSKAERVGQDLGYRTQRQVYDDPAHLGQQVVTTSTSNEQQSANPNAYEEARMAMEEVAKSAYALIDKNRTIENPTERKQAIYNLLQAHQKKLVGQDSTANLFESQSSDTNKRFLTDLKSNTAIMSDFLDVTCKVAKTKRKVLDAEGHKRRSANRPTFVQTMQVDNKNPERKHFIMYIPAGRFTKRQQTLRELQGLDGLQTSHSTTSHQKHGLVHGNSSFVRMIVGSKEPDGSVRVLSDSFSGPGARMPYKDLSSADKYKRMAVKSITFMNQEEVIQSLAQRVYDQKLSHLSDEGIQGMLLQQTPPVEVPEEADRNQLINLYFKNNDLVEVYTQVTSPSQANWPFADGSDANREQFEFVRDAMRAFNGASDLKLEIEDANGNVINVQGNYQGRHGAFGVNWFKSANDSVAGSQNTRFMNQMIDDTLASLQKPEAAEVSEAFEGIHRELLRISEVAPKTSQAINRIEQGLSKGRALYRDQMMDYQIAYQELQNAKASKNTSPEELKALNQNVSDRFKNISKIESKLTKWEQRLDLLNERLEVARKRQFQTSETTIRNQLETFKQALQERYPDGIPQDIQSSYNRCAYLVDAQSLYYSGDWAQDKHNFELQTLVASLATEVGHANTKSCKSNNDRGQRLAQKIAGTTILNDVNGTGLYDGEYFAPKSTGLNTRGEQIDAQLMAIQTLHHTANTGVGGGKFAIRNKEGFADNGLLGKVASLAKLKGIGAEKPFYTKPWQLVATVLTAGLFLVGKAIVSGIQGVLKNRAIDQEAKHHINEATEQVLDQQAKVDEPLHDASSIDVSVERGQSLRAQSVSNMPHLDKDLGHEDRPVVEDTPSPRVDSTDLTSMRKRVAELRESQERVDEPDSDVEHSASQNTGP